MKNKYIHEQIEKKNCKTIEEAKAFLEKEYVELTDEELKEINGRGCIFNPAPTYDITGIKKRIGTDKIK